MKDRASRPVIRVSSARGAERLSMRADVGRGTRVRSPSGSCRRCRCGRQLALPIGDPSAGSGMATIVPGESRTARRRRGTPRTRRRDHGTGAGSFMVDVRSCETIARDTEPAASSRP